MCASGVPDSCKTDSGEIDKAKLEAYVAATNRQLDLELTTADINVAPNPAKRQTSKVKCYHYHYHH